MSSGKQSSAPQTTQTQTIQKADPWSGQQPYLLDIFKEAQNIYQNPGPSYYPGTSVAPMVPSELQAQEWLRQYASDGAAASANQALQSNALLMNPMMMDVANNPYVQGMNAASLGDFLQGMGQGLGDLTQTLERQWLPAVDSGAVASGQYGGSRQGVAQGTAIGDATRSYRDIMQSGMSDMANLFAQTNLGAYGKGVETMGQATALNPSLVQAGAAPMQMLAGTGTQQREMQQALIDDAMARWNYAQGLPTQKLADYSSMVQGAYGGSSSSSTSSTGPAAQSAQPSTGAKVAGAAMTGLGTYAALAPVMGPAAPFVAGAMALATAFL